MFNRRGIRISSECGWSRILPTIKADSGQYSVLHYVNVSLAPIPAGFKREKQFRYNAIQVLRCVRVLFHIFS